MLSDIKKSGFVRWTFFHLGEKRKKDEGEKKEGEEEGEKEGKRERKKAFV